MQKNIGENMNPADLAGPLKQPKLFQARVLPNVFTLSSRVRWLTLVVAVVIFGWK